MLCGVVVAKCVGSRFRAMFTAMVGSVAPVCVYVGLFCHPYPYRRLNPHGQSVHMTICCFAVHINVLRVFGAFFVFPNDEATSLLGGTNMTLSRFGRNANASSLCWPKLGRRVAVVWGESTLLQFDSRGESMPCLPRWGRGARECLW